LSPKLLSSFDQDGVVLHGLPAEAYTSPDIFSLESSQLFERSWTFVGFANDLINVGDIRPINVAGTPLLLVRSFDQQIRVFTMSADIATSSWSRNLEIAKTQSPALTIVGHMT